MFTPLDGMKLFDLYTRTLLHGWLFVAPLKPGVLERRKQTAAQPAGKVVAIKERKQPGSPAAHHEAA